MEALSNIWTSEVVHGVHEDMDKAYGILAQGAAEGFKRRQTVLYKVTRLLAQIAILKWIVAILSVKSATAVTIEPLESEPVTHDYAKPNLRDLAEAMGAWETSNFDKTTLGMRNNNPTNLRWSPFATSYLETKNGRYAQFGTLEEGYRAAVWDLNKKATGQSTHVRPDDTVETLIKVWCNAENWENYSAFVGNKLGVDPRVYKLNEFSS